MASPSTPQAIVVHGFPRLTPSHPSPSGYCQKLECYLRFASIPYTSVTAYPFSAPKGKLPYIRDHNGTVVPDSHFIIRHLISKGFTDLDAVAGLTAAERGEARAWRIYWEDMAYPAIVRMRWFEKDNYNAITHEAFSSIPFPFRLILRYFITSRVLTNLKAAGIGRHTLHEVLSILSTAFSDLATKIAATGGPWLMGTKGPAEIDAVTAGFLLNVLGTRSNPEIVQMIREREELVGYVKRVLNEWWPEYKDVVEGILDEVKTESVS